MKKEINVFDYAGDICKAMPQGILLTTKSGDEVNTMTIGWGMVGIQWGKPIFIAYVRDSRYTRKLLDESGEFTVNVPYGEFDKKILGFCGTKSGRDIDKFKELGLTMEEPVKISVPGIKELPLTLECKVIYQQKQEREAITDEVKKRYYAGVDMDNFHTAYYGEIVGAYIITE